MGKTGKADAANQPLRDILNDPLLLRRNDAEKQELHRQASKARVKTPEHMAKLAAGRDAAVARRRTMTPSERANEKFNDKFDSMLIQFIDACLGQRKFDGLDKRTQAALLVKAMEWSIGRPNTGKPTVPDKEETEQTGIEFV